MIDELVEIIDSRRREHRGGAPFVVGIGGGVGVGKTTLSTALAERLRSAGTSTVVIATDNFLFPNAELSRRGLLMQKGFPETYDVDLIEETVAVLRAGRAVDVPVYDHQSYDIVDERRTIEPTDVLVLEGVNVLQPRVRAVVDLSIYVDVAEAYARQWFFDRFDVLCEEGAGFYASFREMSAEERRSIAESAWTGINLVNLRDHIAPTQASADVVVVKAADHSLIAVRPSR